MRKQETITYEELQINCSDLARWLIILKERINLEYENIDSKSILERQEELNDLTNYSMRELSAIINELQVNKEEHYISQLQQKVLLQNDERLSEFRKHNYEIVEASQDFNQELEIEKDEVEGMNLFKKLFGKQNGMRVANIFLCVMFCSAFITIIITMIQKG